MSSLTKKVTKEQLYYAALIESEKGFISLIKAGGTLTGEELMNKNIQRHMLSYMKRRMRNN